MLTVNVESDIERFGNQNREGVQRLRSELQDALELSKKINMGVRVTLIRFNFDDHPSFLIEPDTNIDELLAWYNPLDPYGKFV